MEFQLGVTRSPQRILFGQGQRRALGAVAAELGKRVLVCTDERLGGDPLIEEIRQGLSSRGLEVRIFDRTEAELPLAGIESCVASNKDFAPQVIVGLGGGSCLDMAKLVSLLIAHGGSASQYYGEFKVPGPVVPLIAMPTTAGTGSEVTPVAVLADPNQEMKIGISSPQLVPHTAICDPELTLTCPPFLTAVSGADALAHAIEAFAAVKRQATSEIAMERVFVGKNALSDQYALSAIKLICRWLPTAVSDGQNLEARSAVMLAATLAGLAFGSAGTAAAHALQYPVGATTHSAHGLGVGILLPYTMDFNLPSCAAEYNQIATELAIDDASAGAVALIRYIRKLFEGLGIPRDLASIGFSDHHVEWAGRRAMLARRLVENNPRPLDVDAASAILRNALVGHQPA